MAGLAFLLSGAAALVYQVAWQRILALHTGVGIESVAIIVAAFMTGLGLGSLAGGLLSTRLGPRAALLAFAALELLVSAYGAASAALLYDLLYSKASWLYAPAWRGALMHFATLLPPTVLMGMSLPFLVRALVWDVRTAGRTIAVLYGVNVVGASLGALTAPWIFIRLYGIRGALLAAAVGNLAAAVAAALLCAGWRGGSRASVPFEPPPDPTAAREPVAGLAVLYALSGFCALSLELLWFRIIEVAVKSTAYTFGTVLAVYLGGIGAGSLAGAWYAPRLRRPLRTFLLSQILILALSGAALIVLMALPPDTPGFRWYFELWGSRRSFNFGGAWSWPAVLRLYLAFPLALFGAPAALMGFSFMALQSAVQDEVRTSGRKAGLLQAANLAGCVAGSLAFGLVALHRLGSVGALRLLLVCGMVFVALGLRRAGGRLPFLVAGTALAALLVTLPDSRVLWLRLHGLADPRVLIGEDATGVAALSPLEDGGGSGWRVWVSGRHHSRLPFGGIHTALGAIPAVMHPSPAEVAVVGLGSGDTAWAAGCRRDATRQVTVFEICAPQVRLLRQVAALPEPPAKLPRFLADPRLRVVVADGRNALERSAAAFDVIEMDALFPTSPYSGNLYSVEFYSLSARRLRPGGLMCTWAPTARVRASFARAFPHVLEFGDGVLLVGSPDRIPLDFPAWRDRLRSAAVRAYLGASRAEEVMALLRTARPMAPPAGVSANHDLFPRDEFNVP